MSVKRLLKHHGLLSSVINREPSSSKKSNYIRHHRHNIMLLYSLVLLTTLWSSKASNTSNTTNTSETTTTIDVCAVVEGGNCTTCINGEASGCTAVTCEANKFDTDSDATNGCEAGCPTVAGGTCDTCSAATTCTAVTCATNKFDTDSNATNGCEAGCAAVADGTCTACTSAVAGGCTAVTCEANKFDTDINATNGCEAGCAAVTDGTCTACTSAVASGCTAVICATNKFDSNGYAVDGCEAGCPQLPGGTCEECSSTTTCTKCAEPKYLVNSEFCSNWDQNNVDSNIDPTNRYPDCEAGKNNLTDDTKCQCWTKNGNTLYNNEESTSISICNATHDYCNEDYAHCLTNNYCNNLNGLEQHLDVCLCTLAPISNSFVPVPGRRIEDPNKKHVATLDTCFPSQQYCSVSLGIGNRCRTEQNIKCSNTNGQIKNNFVSGPQCACGNIGVCNTDMPFCSFSNSLCTPNIGNSCPYTEGININEFPCSCGSNTGVENCDANMFCTVAVNGNGACTKKICPASKHSLCDDKIVLDNENNPLYYNGFQDFGECATPSCDTDADVQQCCNPCSVNDWDPVRNSCSRECPSNFDCSATTTDTYILPQPGYRFDPAKLNDYSERETERFKNGFTGYCYSVDGVCATTPMNIQTCCLETDKCRYQDNTLCIHSQGYYKPLTSWHPTRVCQGVLCRPRECCDFVECVCANGTAHLPLVCQQNGQHLCQSCDNGFFLNNTFCQRGSACRPDQYTIEEAKTNSDTLCGQLTACGTNEYIQIAHTATSNRLCAPLTSCDVKKQYESIPKTLDSDRQCQDFTDCDATTQWEATAPTSTTDRVCVDISPPCNYTTQWEATAPTSTTDRVCVDLSPPCNYTTQWLRHHHTTTQDRLCEAISTACSAVEYETQAPSPSQDRLCKPRTICDPQSQFEVDEGTPTTDRICSNLSDCSRYEYISTNKTSVSDRNCLSLSTCNSEQYELKAPVLSTEMDMYVSDRVCSVCRQEDGNACRGCLDPEDCYYDNRALVHGDDRCLGEPCTFYNYGLNGSHTIFENSERQSVDTVVLKNNGWVRFESMGTVTGVFVLSDNSTKRQINNDDATLYYTSFKIPAQVQDFSVSFNGIMFDLQQNCVKETVLNTSVCVVTNRTCVNGRMKGTRAIWWTQLVSASNGGEECPANPYYEYCENEQCDVDCQEECNVPWSDCLNPQGVPVQCGEQGTRTKRCTVEVESKHAGVKCSPVKTKHCTGLPNENTCDCRGNVLDGCGVCGGTCCPPGQYRDRCGICGGTNQCDSTLKLRASSKHTHSKAMRVFVPSMVFVLLMASFTVFCFCICRDNKHVVETVNKEINLQF